MPKNGHGLSVEVKLRDMPGHISQAFEWYYNQGGERALRKVATEFGKSGRTVYRWSKLYGWQVRVEDRDREINTRVANKNTTDLVAKKSVMLAEVDGLLKPVRELITKLAESKTPLNVTDLEGLERLTRSLERLHKLQLLLLGDSTGGADIKIDIKLPDDLSLDDL